MAANRYRIKSCGSESKKQTIRKRSLTKPNPDPMTKYGYSES